MAHEIEADFVFDWGNENSQCQKCTSYQELGEGIGYCSEAQSEVPEDAHCDVFQSRD